MAKIRVLLVDDSVVFRRLVSEELAKDPALEVCRYRCERDELRWRSCRR